MEAPPLVRRRERPESRAVGLLLGVAGGAFLAAAWRLPGSLPASLFTWLCTLLLVIILERRSRSDSFAGLYLVGTVSHLVAFHWLYHTIKDFGGFPVVAAAAIFGLFVLVSALQFPLVGLIYRLLPSGLDAVGIRGALAWVATETLVFRIFPWQLGHTHSALLPLVQIASIGGTTLVTFLVFWVCEVMVGLLRSRVTIEAGAAVFAFLLASVGYGYWSIATIDGLPSDPLDVALVQGNISLVQKHDIKSFEVNRERYVELSRQIAVPGMLVIWPESVINEFVSARLREVYADDRLPQMPRVSFLLGALTAESRTRYFNSALAIDPNGRLDAPYHKRILMPFGEFTPFGSTFPWLKEINSTAPDFTPGETVGVFRYPHPREDRSIGVAPLICYEDVLPSLSRDAVRQGAELLVNITNDAWFGKTVAPYQHHLIASFRAIENRRFLLRSTNSGLTAVVDPVGRTVSQLPIYTEGSLLDKVNLIRYGSLYSTTVGETPWFCLAVFVVAVAFGRGLFGRWRGGHSTATRGTADTDGSPL